MILEFRIKIVLKKNLYFVRRISKVESKGIKFRRDYVGEWLWVKDKGLIFKFRSIVVLKVGKILKG